MKEQNSRESIVISIEITLIDYIMRLITISLVKLMGFRTRSQEVRQLMTIIFVTQLFNMGVLIILSQANLETPLLSFIPMIGKFVFGDETKGRYH